MIQNVEAYFYLFVSLAKDTTLAAFVSLAYAAARTILCRFAG